MADPWVTLDDIEKLLQLAKKECAWEEPAYLKSEYVYVGKGHLASLGLLLSKLREEVTMLRGVQEQEDTKGQEIRDLEDLLHAGEGQFLVLTRENQNLKNEIQRLQALDQAPAATQLRKLHTLLTGGATLTAAEHNTILQEAEDVLGRYGK